MRRSVVVVLAVATAMAGIVSTTSAATGRAAAGPPYMDPSLPISQRVSDLMSRMTLREKVGQMDQIVVGRLRAASDPGTGECNGDNTTQPQPNCLQRVLIDYDVGSILDRKST